MVAKLIAVEGPDKGLEFTLEDAQEWTLGRDPEACNFVVSDPKVSAKHVLIREKNGKYFIENLSTTNPTKIGDEEIKRSTRINDLEMLHIGDTWFRFSRVELKKKRSQDADYDNFFEDTSEYDDELSLDYHPTDGLGHNEPTQQEPKEEPKEEKPQEKKPEEQKPEEKPPEDQIPKALPTPEEVNKEINEQKAKEESSNQDQKPQEPKQEEKKPEEPPKQEPAKSDEHFDTIFEDLGDQETFNHFSDDYLGQERFLLKVLSGPNQGAEFTLRMGQSYIIGTDIAGSDIVFNDLSVSRHHARLTISDQEEILLEDLDSRNGTVVDGQKIAGQQAISSKNQVTLGTTTFVIVDREQAEQTYVPVQPKPEAKTEEKPPEKEEAVEPSKPSRFKIIKESTFVVTGIIVALILVLGVGAITLFKTSPVDRPKMDYTKEIQKALGDQFCDVKFTYSSSQGSVFLVGHVLSTVDKEELLYNLNNLPFISQINDNVVVDDVVAGEMNQVLSRYPLWRSISMQVPQPGRFVLTGYLETREEAAELDDFVNVQFPYVDRLTNYVVIEEDLNQDILSKLHNHGFYSVEVQLSNGEVSLSGYINSSYEQAFEKTIREICRIVGVRSVNNYVVVVGPCKDSLSDEKAKVPYPSEGSPGSINQPGEPAKSAEAIKEEFGSWMQDSCVINITDYPKDSMDISHMYSIEGYADQGAIGRAVVIKGRILTVGDYLNEMKIVGIFENYVFLEKNGLKYKIEFKR